MNKLVEALGEYERIYNEEPEMTKENLKDITNIFQVKDREVFWSPVRVSLCVVYAAAIITLIFVI